MPYKTQISPTLAQYFNRIVDLGGIRPESKNTFFKVLPKPGRDPLHPGSYRPISLIDQDLKILSKILADRLATFLPNLIGPSQVGVVKGRFEVSNIRNVTCQKQKHLVPIITSLVQSGCAWKIPIHTQGSQWVKWGEGRFIC